MGHRYIWPVLTLLIFLAGLANTVQGSEMLKVTVDGRPVGDSIAMPYSGPEGDPVSALKVEVSGVSGPVRFAIDPAGADGCKGGEWEHASRDLMVAHDRQVNYYRAPASDWHPCSSARLGVIHDESGQEVWWTVSFTDGSVPPAPSSSRALYEIDPGPSSDMPLAAVEKVLYNGEEITPEHTILYEGSRIRTGPDVQITIRYSTGALVKLLSNSEMRIEPPTIIKDSISVMNSRLIDGILHYFGQSEKAKAEMKYEFETETAIVGIKGTLFTLTYEGGRTSLFVSEGEVEFTDKLTGRTSTVRGGEKAVSGAGQEVSQDNQNLALGKNASQSSTAEEWGGNWSASRGVDGIKTANIYDGGFHTGYEESPWWQVDLGSVYDLSEVRIYNRLDCCSERAGSLEVLLSRDGESWWTVYTHDGTPFGGSDGDYLSVDLEGERARFVRVALREAGWLHLDEVEVYPSPPAEQEDDVTESTGETVSDADMSRTPPSDGSEICRGGLEGEWSSGSTHVTISSLGNGSYYLVGTDGNFEHTGVMTCDGGFYHGYLSDTPGRCCGNDGEAWIKVIDDDTYAATSRWWPKGSARPEPIEQTGYEGWERFRRVS
ncbi:MAG: discoidin domain-containing protein [Methanothrix sp.]|nr:discoidin domain-containing protein [Methanothrix sp.]